MGATSFHCVTLSDFNLDNFNALLANDDAGPCVHVTGTGFGQLHQALLDPGAPCWQKEANTAIVWTRPESVSPTFKNLKNFQAVSLDQVLEEVDEFARLLASIHDRVSTVLVPAWTTPPAEHGLGLLEMQEGVGIAGTLMHMNMRLSSRLSGHAGYYVLDAQRWIHKGGSTACNPKLWSRAKIPFSNQVFKAAVGDVKAALRAVGGGARKLVVVDLDNTLWGGVVGDEGWENVRLGGHDPIGEAFVDFQHALKALTHRGIALGMVSKNTEEVALEAIEKHPEMVLALDDFAGWRINWEDKARNVAELVKELNLGLQSVVFIDDNPFERARVAEALSEVLVPEWPEDPLLYTRTLRSMNCFDAPSLTSEDRKRASMYVAERKRTSLKSEVQSMEQWLHTLDMTVQVESPNDSNFARIAQLLNKTNQMNLRTRRMSEKELQDWLKGDNRGLFAFKVSDRFGEAGLTGILSLEQRDNTAFLTDFILSCRVMGRQVEETMVAVAARQATQMGLSRLVAEYLPTPKNKPCLEFWQRSGFDSGEESGIFTWTLQNEYPVPGHIRLAYDPS